MNEHKWKYENSNLNHSNHIFKLLLCLDFSFTHTVHSLKQPFSLKKFMKS